MKNFLTSSKRGSFLYKLVKIIKKNGGFYGDFFLLHQKPNYFYITRKTDIEKQVIFKKNVFTSSEI